MEEKTEKRKDEFSAKMMDEILSFNTAEQNEILHKVRENLIEIRMKQIHEQTTRSEELNDSIKDLRKGLE